MQRRHALGVKRVLLPFIANGKKTLEVRLAHPFMRGIRRGDIIVFNGRYPRQVTRIRHYKTVELMLASEDSQRIAPGMKQRAVRNALHRLLKTSEHRLPVLVFELKTD